MPRTRGAACSQPWGARGQIAYRSRWTASAAAAEPAARIRAKLINAVHFAHRGRLLVSTTGLRHSFRGMSRSPSERPSPRWANSRMSRSLHMDTR